MNNKERIDNLGEAQELIGQAIDLIAEAVRGTSLQGAAEAYLISVLQTAISENNEWLGQNPSNIQSMIEELYPDEDDDEL